jgi:membrane protein DedA with SNARE-associated domain
VCFLSWYTLDMKYYLKLLSVPLLFLVLYTSLFLIWELADLPSVEEFTVIVGNWFDDYGLFAVLLGAFLEGMLLVGSYFPGVFVIFLGVIVAESPYEAVLSVVVATIGLLAAHISNYYLGKYGWYRLLVKFGMKEAIEHAKAKLERRGPIAIPLSYWMPSIGSLTDTAAGIIHLPFHIFIIYSIFSSIFWYSLAGFLVYFLGQETLTIAAGGTGMVLVYSFVAIWVLIILMIDYRKRKYNL